MMEENSEACHDKNAENKPFLPVRSLIPLHSTLRTVSDCRQIYTAVAVDLL